MSIFDQVASAFASDFVSGQTVNQPYQPPQRQPLTLNQLREHWQVAKVLDMTDAEIDFADYVLIARDVEALHGIKEKNTEQDGDCKHCVNGCSACDARKLKEKSK